MNKFVAVLLLGISQLCVIADLPWTNHVIHSSYTTPVGIPMPAFGITNTHWMYHPDLNPSATYNYGAGAVPYRTNSYGPYSYYVDNTAGGAMDGTNTYGTPAVPRLTFPFPVVAGSVVMVANGGTYTFNNGASSTMRFGGNGTAALPVFITAVGASTNFADRPKISGKSVLSQGEWFIIENFALTNNTTFATRCDLYTGPITNFCLRGMIGEGTGVSSSVTVFAVSQGTDTNYIKNMVVFTNIVSRYGDYTNAAENDACFVIFRDYSTNCWMLANDTTRFGGDSVRIGSNEDNDNDTCRTSFHYLGGNRMYQNGENAVDIKKANRSVISGNLIYDFQGYVPTGGDASISAHYNPNYTWLINNVIHTGIQGMNTGSRMQATNEMWHVGNIIYGFSDSAIYWRGQFTNFFYNNTIALTRHGYEVDDGGSPQLNVRMTNNIIFQAITNILDFRNSTTRGLTKIGFDNYYDTTNLVIEWGTDYNTVAAFEAAVATVGDLTQLDPEFVNSGSGDFNLTESSPMINTGHNVFTQMEAAFLAQFGFALNYRDMNGVNPLVDGLPDVGALNFFEEVPPGVVVSDGVTISIGVTIQ
jgi:hypothetical protein